MKVVDIYLDKVKTSVKFVKILEQVKTLACSRVFTDLLSKSHRHSPRFSPGYEGTENMFFFKLAFYYTETECYKKIHYVRMVFTRKVHAEIR